MYEMEGALLAAPYQVASYPAVPAWRAARRCRIPAPDTGFPVPPAFPGVASEGYPFPTVRVFLLGRHMSRKGFRESHVDFFAIHILPTGRGKLSAGSEGFPPAYAQALPQPFHSPSTDYRWSRRKYYDLPGGNQPVFSPACSRRTTPSASPTCWSILVIELNTWRTMPCRSITYVTRPGSTPSTAGTP
jgi:hypothetical protein